MPQLTAEWLNAGTTRAVVTALQRGGHQVFFVGGCVRNALMKVPVRDIDLATDARPEAVMRLADAQGLRAIGTGEEHGTVTVVSGDTAFEVTTFRKDVETDGRHARVAFSDRMEDDAHRRDFTMNALYAQPDGKVLDPVGGLKDLRARRVRFVGEAAARITEDYLRALRFFRFHAWYGDPEKGIDPVALAAITEHAAGIDRLSRERIGHEMLRLLEAPDPAPAVAAMRICGLLARVWPGAEGSALTRLVDLERKAGVAPRAARRMAVMGDDGISDRLRLSRAIGRELGIIREAATGVGTALALGHRLGSDTGTDALLARWALLEMPFNAEGLASIEKGASAVFPVIAADLMPDLQGAALGKALRRLESAWVDSGCRMSRDELLSQL